jgi:signal transduction histidine kinase
MKSYRNWWTVYGICSGLLLLVTAWSTVTLLSFEGRETRLQAASAIQEDMRLGLWRMDSLNESLLAGESARAFHHYRAYYPHQRAYTRLLEAFGPNDLLVASPLLGHVSSIVLLHLQREVDGQWTSPQVPKGNLRDLAEASGVDGAQIDMHAALLERIAAAMDEPALASGALAEVTALGVSDARARPMHDAEDAINAIAQISRDQDKGLKQAQAAQQQAPPDTRSLQERQARTAWLENKQALAAQEHKGIGLTLASMVEEVDVAPFSPSWIDVDGPLLLFSRNVSVGDVVHEQCFVVDFQVLAGELLAGVRDLFPNAALRPIVPGSDETSVDKSRQLATLPAVLETGRRPIVVAAGLTPMRMALLMAWFAVIAVIVAVGLTLRSIIAQARRRTRFASAVTHELRTPLTTFQLYAEMLDEGLVKDEATRSEYHRTLRRESNRLGRLVENVLAHARLEEGRHVTQRESIRAGALIDRMLPSLCDRAAAADMTLSMAEVLDADTLDVRMTTSPEVVEQILGNLVDNACKYGAAPLFLRTQTEGEWLLIDIEDGGGGVPVDLADRIFEPFDRGARQDGDPSAGVGLGLALSRDLARDIGGGLTLQAGMPTTFRLRLPVQ